MNHIVLAGNLTADPELRYTQSGKAVANFTVAVSRNERRNGTWAEVTDGFFNVVAWGQLGEHIASSCKKGARVLVSGKLVQRNFEVEGNKRSSIEITASAVGPELKFAPAEVSVETGPGDGLRLRRHLSLVLVQTRTSPTIPSFATPRAVRPSRASPSRSATAVKFL